MIISVNEWFYKKNNCETKLSISCRYSEIIYLFFNQSEKCPE